MIAGLGRKLGTAALVLVIGCGGAAVTSGAKVAEADRTRSTLVGRDAETLAPQAFAEAEQALRAAKEAERAGDTLGAELQAERAVAAFQHAVAVARLARATEEEIAAKASLGKALEEVQRFSAARKAAEREADDLEKQLKIAREAERPASSGTGPADPERERARLVAAQALATQARLLCGAARLVSPQAPGLAEAEASATELEKKLESSPRPAPIDAAARARANCLSALTKARRAGATESDPADALLGELSRARIAEGDVKREGPTKPSADAGRRAELAPTRDERGVVVTLRSLFRGEGITPDGEASLKELGRVAAAHPTFGVQVVLHSATPPTAGDVARERKLGDAIVKALAEGGATKTKVELAGARAPVFDPADARRRDKNARVEIVFVGG